MTTTVYSSDYYSQLQKRQNEMLKQGTIVHGTGDTLTMPVTAEAEANIIPQAATLPVRSAPPPPITQEVSPTSFFKMVIQMDGIGMGR